VKFGYKILKVAENTDMWSSRILYTSVLRAAQWQSDFECDLIFTVRNTKVFKIYKLHIASLGCGSWFFAFSETLATTQRAWMTQSCTENHSVFL
jgi:hypothetical protein